MGKIVSHNNACLSVKCGSSDARQIYEDKTSFCFACKTFFDEKNEPMLDDIEVVSSKRTTFEKKKLTVADVREFPFGGFRERKLKRVVTEFYDVRVSYDADGKIDSHFYPCGDGYKARRLPKQFYWIGKASLLFGMDKFNAGGKRLVITEGELDAMSVNMAYYEKYERFYPVISLSSSSAVEEILLHRTYIRSFEEIILMFDNDEPGQTAARKAAKLIGFDKVKIAKLPLNDPSDVFCEMGGQALLRCVYDAQEFSPASIIEKEDLWNQMVEYNKKESRPYPPCFAGVNQKLKGKRGGEITLLISGTGAGKSTIFKEDMLFSLECGEKIGVISLEETPAEYAKRLCAMYLKRSVSEEEISDNDLRVAFDHLFGPNIILLDHQSSVQDSSLTDMMEYMCLMGCTSVYLDHITLAVSDGYGDSTGNEAQDKFMGELSRLSKKYSDTWFGVISHLRKTNNTSVGFEAGRIPSLDDIKGSGSIKQIAFDVIAFARDSTAAELTKRNTVQIEVLKARFTGKTGPAGNVRYNGITGRLEMCESAESEAFSVINEEDVIEVKATVVELNLPALTVKESKPEPTPPPAKETPKSAGPGSFKVPG